MSTHVEEWRTCVGFPDYEVSDSGHVRRATPGGNRAVPGRLKAVHLDSTNYPTVSLPSGRCARAKRVRVHVLVAAAFLGPRPSGFEIDHLNSNRADNRLCNLEYVAGHENRRRASAKLLEDLAGQICQRRGRHVRLSEDAVIRGFVLRQAGWSILQISQFFGVGRTTIESALSGLSWRHVSDPESESLRAAAARLLARVRGVN